MACPFRTDFLQALAIEGKLGACVLSHLFRDFEPVHGHELRILRPHPFAKYAKGWGTRLGWRTLLLRETQRLLSRRMVSHPISAYTIFDSKGAPLFAKRRSEIRNENFVGGRKTSAVLVRAFGSVFHGQPSYGV